MILVNNTQTNKNWCYNFQKRTNKKVQDFYNPVDLAPVPAMHQVEWPCFKGVQFPESNQNKIVSEKFDKDYNSGQMSELTVLMNKVLPPLSSAAPDKLSEVAVNETGHIQINHPDFGHVFSNMGELSDMEFKRFIADGVRGSDPAPQPDWEKTALAKQWPPSEKQKVKFKPDTAAGVMGFENENPDYQSTVRGMVSVDPVSGSVIWAYQQENNNPKLDWAAWTVAPFRVPQGRKALAIFPVSADFNGKYQETVNTKNQWEIDADKGIVTVKPNETGGFFDPFDSETSWCAFGIEGSDKVMVMRSIYKMPYEDKFKACTVEDNARYVELEFMSPKVKKGNKSTIACRLEFVPLAELGIKGLEKFEKEKMGEQMKAVSSKLIELLN